MKKFTINDNAAFSLELQIGECSSPKDLHCVEFVQRIKTENKPDSTSNYQFFLTKEEMMRVSKSFLEATNE